MSHVHINYNNNTYISSYSTQKTRFHFAILEPGYTVLILICLMLINIYYLYKLPLGFNDNN